MPYVKYCNGWTAENLMIWINDHVTLANRFVYNLDTAYKKVWENGDTYEFKFVVYGISIKKYEVYVNGVLAMEGTKY